MQTKQFTYHNLGYWFLLFIGLTFAGFYHTYFVKLPDIKTPIIHIHFILMGLWILMLIAQPFLIKNKKLATHRLLGKVSYILVPLAKHARYMLATALILLGPTVDRIVAINLGIKSIAGVSTYFVSMLIIDFILCLLLYIDFKNKRETKTLAYCLLIFITSQLAFYVLPTFDWWAVFVKSVMLLNIQ